MSPGGGGGTEPTANDLPTLRVASFHAQLHVTEAALRSLLLRMKTPAIAGVIRGGF